MCAKICNFALFEATEGQTVTYLMNFQGINRVARRSLLLHRLATVEQPGWVPRLTHQGLSSKAPCKVLLRFTKEGWRVDQLEPRLAGMLNVARMQVSSSLVLPNLVWFGFRSKLVWFGLQSSPVQFSPIQLSSGFEAAGRRGGDL